MAQGHLVGFMYDGAMWAWIFPAASTPALHHTGSLVNKKCNNFTKTVLEEILANQKSKETSFANFPAKVKILTSNSSSLYFAHYPERLLYSI